MEKLFAGAAKAAITPDKALLKALVAESHRNLTGIYEDIYVRVIVLSDGLQKIALITVDLNRFPAQKQMRDILVSNYGIDSLGCIFGCTRNHQADSETIPEESVPTGKPPVPLGDAHLKYITLVHQKTCQAIAEAIQKMQPAKLGSGIGYSYLNACRNWPTPAGVLEAAGINEIANRQLTVLRIASLEDETIALFVNYAMHGSFLCHPSFDLLGSEITGAISKYVECHGKEKFPVLWAAGGGGDQNIALSARMEYCGLDEKGDFTACCEVLPKDAAQMIMRRLAATQGLDIINTASAINNYQSTFQFFGAECSGSIKGKQAPMLLNSRLSILNDIAFVGVNGEITTRHVNHIRNLLADKTVVFLDMSYGHLGCIPDPEAEAMNGYAANRTHCQSGREATDTLYENFAALYDDYKTLNP